jgi:predicted phage-related endonuclease
LDKDGVTDKKASVFCCPDRLRSALRLETAQQIANHESPRTTKLYGRREEEISLDEVERIAIQLWRAATFSTSAEYSFALRTVS